MNIQTIQILFLLFDGVARLGPWRIVTEAMDRIGYGANEGLAPSSSLIAVVCAGLYVSSPISILGAILLAGCLGGAMASHLRVGSPLFSLGLFSPGLFGLILARMVRDRSATGACTDPCGVDLAHQRFMD